jgi:hypothetical protein
MRRLALGVVASLVAFAALAPARAADEPALGTFSVVLEEGKKSTRGTATIRPDGDEIVLGARLADGRTLAGRCPRGGAAQPGVAFVSSSLRTFPLATSGDTPGLADGVTGVAASSEASATTLELTLTPLANFRGLLRSGDVALGKATFTRDRGVLVFHAGAWVDDDAKFFEIVAMRIAAYYASCGYARRDRHLALSWDGVIATLLAAEAEGRPYDRVVFVGHGGWNGPILSSPNSTGPSQASGGSETELFKRFADALRRGTTPRARVYLSGCHAGGSNAAERTPGVPSYVYADDLARRARRLVAGPAGPTSTEDALAQIRAALERELPLVQETRVATAAGGKSYDAGETIGN